MAARKERATSPYLPYMCPAACLQASLRELLACNDWSTPARLCLQGHLSPRPAPCTLLRPATALLPPALGYRMRLWEAVLGEVGERVLGIGTAVRALVGRLEAALAAAAAAKVRACLHECTRFGACVWVGAVHWGEESGGAMAARLRLFWTGLCARAGQFF
jgi:hypothetical protein